MDYSGIVAVIPAYKPNRKLLSLLEELKDFRFKKIIVVNDGSGEAFDDIFSEIKQFDYCELISYEINEGKGAALKKAFSYCLEEIKEFDGVVTADADGQHLPKDIISVCDEMLKENKVVFGVRNFDSENVPKRSKFGNKTTRGVFKLFLGLKLTDTQTGLRAYPKKYLIPVLKSPGTRYEYESNILFTISREKMEYSEVVIDTVYEDNNSSSHFRAVRDSIRIYSMFIKYMSNSLICTGVDQLLFYLFKVIINNLPNVPAFIVKYGTYFAGYPARVFSALLNYYLNSNVIFHKKARKDTFLRFCILSFVQISVSNTAVWLLERVFTGNSSIISTLLKIIVDIILFFCSFRIQNKWVFKTDENEIEGD